MNWDQKPAYATKWFGLDSSFDAWHFYQLKNVVNTF